MVFNHVSYLDSFGLVGMCAPSGVSKASNADLPILGSCVRALQNIDVPDKKQVIKSNGKDANSPPGTSIAQMITNR